MLKSVLSLCACIGFAPIAAVSAASSKDAPPDSAAAHHYQVKVLEDLRSIRVRAEFTTAATSVASGQGDADLLQDLRRCDEGPLQIRRNRIVGNSISCLEYRYPLDTERGRRAPPVDGGVVVSSPAAWLWLPRESEESIVRVEFSLPDATAVSVPWRQIAHNQFEIPRSPGSSTASAVFGSFELRQIESAGARLQVALVNGPGRHLDTTRMLDWLSAAASDVAQVGGRFPSSEVQVIVQPVPPRGDRGAARGSAVPFGYVIRDGGEAVRFFVDADRPLEDFLGDWTATHEFSHLLLPYVVSREKWISEGFASYYQNVLLARRGVYSESEVWQRLHRAFAQADAIADPPELGRIDERPFWEVRMLIYWSGAAIALMADTRLRELSDGRESLDTVLGRLADCCLPSERSWTGAELFERLDTLSPFPVFTDLYRQHVNSAGMPEFESIYTDLGIVAEGSRVRLRDDARLASIRQAIMQPRLPGAAEQGGH